MHLRHKPTGRLCDILNFVVRDGNVPAAIALTEDGVVLLTTRLGPDGDWDLVRHVEPAKVDPVEAPGDGPAEAAATADATG